ncbi:hypothetical protein [Zavarzinia aquatilis]|uniref:hypothetical protein n=1 Tax=Zavarzinia aquatilis TaxID=2211142 RepID=UPI001057C38E|nr:hypothetical protein [Zavarzinia aquatilis]
MAHLSDIRLRQMARAARLGRGHLRTACARLLADLAGAASPSPDGLPARGLSDCVPPAEAPRPPAARPCPCGASFRSASAERTHCYACVPRGSHAVA